MFNRMPDYWIHGCTEKQFDAHTFKVGQGKTEQVEGQLWDIRYYPQASLRQRPSELQILRNFESAVTQQGGAVVFSDKSRRTFRFTVDGKELWVDASAEFTGKYRLTIVQRGAMPQTIVANAATFASALKNTGHAAVYGIHFDTGKSNLKPESEQAIGEMAKLLKAEAKLDIHVVGHTDNVGAIDSNMKLSQERAEAVVQALIQKHGIPGTRLRSFGNGPFAPVASNDSEEGRSKNRRVELVKR